VVAGVLAFLREDFWQGVLLPALRQSALERRK